MTKNTVFYSNQAINSDENFVNNKKCPIFAYNWILEFAPNILAAYFFSIMSQHTPSLPYRRKPYDIGD